MFQEFLMRSVASVISATLGSFGVFCLVDSYYVPHLAVQGLLLLGAASAMVCFSRR